MPVCYHEPVAEPTSWYAIEPGWDILDRAGQVVGEVTEVVGDTDADILDGIRFETVDGEERFAPAEQVGDITDGSVSLEVELSELDSSATEPGGAEVRPEPDAGA